MTLVEFLLARIAEDEIRDVHERRCGVNDDMGPTDCDCGVPARVLAECGAKQRIVELHALVVQDGQPEPVCGECSDDYRGPRYVGPCETLRLLALPYADHPDYDQAWRP